MRSDKIVILLSIASFLFLLLVSCKGRNQAEIPVKKGRGDGMTELNRYLVEKDREIIKNYIERKELKMTESSTGLWFMLLEPGEGALVKDNDIITMNYEVSLLDGTGCYSSDSQGPKKIVLGKTKIEQGLDEGLRLLKPGGEAIFIMPPYLAYGLIGDGKKIPPRATIVYTVKIVQESIKK